MWILPRQLHTSRYVPDTAALISDLNEQSQLCTQSLLVRSKPSPARTWSLKWKRDSWTLHLSGRILKPSHGQSFVTAWTSCLAATRASRSAPPASDSDRKTPDTSGRTYQPELLQCDQVAVSLKTSRDISRWGCPTSSKTWQEWVTERRGAYHQRLKSGRRISASGSSSWPTATAVNRVRSEDTLRKCAEFRKRNANQNTVPLYLEEVVQRNWPTVTANEDSYRINGESQQSKCLSAMARRGEMSGPAAPASSNTDGSRRGLWRTPNAQLIEAKPLGTKLTGRTPQDPQVGLADQALYWRTPQAQEAGARVETLYTKDGQPARPGERAYRLTPNGKLVLQSQTINQQVEMVERKWPTPRTMDGQIDESLEAWQARHARKEAEGINLHRPLTIAVKQEDFPTPRTCDWKSSPNADSNIRREQQGQATLSEFVHAKHKKGDMWSTPRTGAADSSRPNNKGGIPLADQAKREQWATPMAWDHWMTNNPRTDGRQQQLPNQVQSWATPQAHDAQGPKTPEQIQAMRAKGHGVKNLNEQAAWGTPTARDHKSGRGNEDREYKELTPMVERKQAGKLNPRWVETLMGLPVGWVMPSCASPVTIAPTSYDSSEMALCLQPQSGLLEFSLGNCSEGQTAIVEGRDDL
jgi:hypothetical protein